MSESRAARFARDWLSIGDDRKVRGWDSMSDDRKSADFPDWDAEESGDGIDPSNIPFGLNDVGIYKPIGGGLTGLSEEGAETYTIDGDTINFASFDEFQTRGFSVAVLFTAEEVAASSLVGTTWNISKPFTSLLDGEPGGEVLSHQIWIYSPLNGGYFTASPGFVTSPGGNDRFFGSFLGSLEDLDSYLVSTIAMTMQDFKDNVDAGAVFYHAIVVDCLFEGSDESPADSFTFTDDHYELTPL